MSLPIDHARLPKPGDTFAEKYRLECVLGSGGMGVVFGATHLLTHKRVAIKWLAVDSSGGTLSDTTQRFMREARLAGEFHHPNVVQVYDVGESQGSFFMVMEWLEGESLAGRLERVGRLSFQETLQYLVPCMQAIQRAHDAGIIHRDIKPANIFLCEPTVDRPALSKVLDFGISKRMSSSLDTGTFVTQTGMLIGTPHYLAPEQLRARPIDRRTDIYGFGVLLYETLAGVLPFTADNFGDLIVQISTSTPRSLRELVPDLPLGVERVVAKAMARNPDERFHTLYELIAHLEAIDPSPLTAATMPQLRLPSSVSPIAIEPSGARASSDLRRRRVLALLTAAAMGAVGMGLVLRQQASRGEVAARATLRPRALPQPTAAGPAPDPFERDAVASAALGDPLPVQQLDASVDAGKPIPLQAQAAAGRGAATTIVADTAQPAPAPVKAVEPAALGTATSAPDSSRPNPSPKLEKATATGAIAAKPVAAEAAAAPAPAPALANGTPNPQGPASQPTASQPTKPASAPRPAPAAERGATAQQPTAAAADTEPKPHDAINIEPSPAEGNAREHNPLHMDIQ